MPDYVHCLECNNSSSRKDTFLDLSLVIKPFGSTQPIKSIEEALKKFVEYETLEGDNQYLCGNCGKKVLTCKSICSSIQTNAHKGLEIVSLPYILTLQLKRFDYDIFTERRIKLNERYSNTVE